MFKFKKSSIVIIYIIVLNEGDYMKDIYNIYRKELSKNNILYFIVLIVFFVGLIVGSFYITFLNNSDKKYVLDSVSNFFNLKYSFSEQIKIFKKSLIDNNIYFIIMWLLGISGIGIIFIYLMVFFKAFTLGFSLAGIFAKYKFNGFIISIIYLFPSHLIICFLTILLSTYSLNISINLLINAFKKKQLNFNNFMGKYLYILFILILFSFICSLIDGFVTPYFIKIFTKFIK